MIKQVRRRFHGSRHLDQSPMYPGEFLCTYVLVAGAVWMMVDMQPIGLTRT